MRNVDNLLIGRLYGPQPLGLYAKAYGLLLVPLQRVWFPISTVAMPALSRLADTPDRYRHGYARIVAAVCLLTMPLVAFLMGTSDWLIITLLGPQWTEASAIFAWLGVSGLIEPFSTMTVWLLLTQGRTRQQFHWGLINAVLTIAAIIAGLPWGPVGVAASYGLVGLVIRTPLLFWFVGRDGPVRTRDFYMTLAPFATASCAILLAIFAFRHWADISTPLIGLAGAAGLTIVVTGLILFLLPSGRAVVRDVHSVVVSLVNKRGTPSAQ
jgi:PST family polysaccharide transporter